MFTKKKAQSTLEYVIVLTAIVGAILAIVVTTIGQRSEAVGLGKLLKNVGTKITDSSGRVATIIP